MFANLNIKFFIVIILVICLIILMIYIYKKYFNKSPSYVANREFIKIKSKDGSSGDSKDGSGNKCDNSDSGDGGGGSGGGGGKGGDSGKTKYAHVMLFSASWCPYCNKLQKSGVYDEFKNQNNGKTINGYKLNITNEDCSDDKDGKVQKFLSDYNIDGFPTIKIHKDGEMASESKEFNCEPTLENLNNFLKKSL